MLDLVRQIGDGWWLVGLVLVVATLTLIFAEGPCLSCQDENTDRNHFHH